ncbi:MAG TPA: HDIG domain-containing protein [Solirubrobacterales bacterium]|nr:HDIG domain-containing protein [Solirubrobacterales bacterium]
MSGDLGRLDRAPSVAAARAALERQPRSWIVGGAIRDALLGEDVSDADLAVERGQEESTARGIAKVAGGTAFQLSEEHATWRAIAPADGWHVDVVPLRAETIEDDLRARDFAVNAIARPLDGGELIDPTGGIPDAEARRLRAASEEAFRDDPIRLLRAARLAARHELAIEPGTAQLARVAAERAADPAGERQFAELRGIVAGPRPLRGIELLDELGLTATVLPELEALRGVVQNPNHHLDVLGHTLAVLEEWLGLERDMASFAGDLAAEIDAFLDEPLADELTRRDALRFGALFHDLGKPETRSEGTGYVTFIGHDEVGAEIIAEIGRRLRVSRRLSTHLQGLALHHLRLGFLIHRRPLARRGVYEYLVATEPVTADVTLLTVADRLAARGEGPLASPEMIQAHLDLALEMLREALPWHRDGPPPPPLSGDDLESELGLEPGPDLGRILEELRAETFTGEISGRDQALRRARELV